MASFQKSLDLDSLTVNQIFTSGNNNTNSILPAYRVLTTDGRGGTSWMTLSTLQGGGAFHRINTTSAVFIADASSTTFSIYDGTNAGLSPDPTALNTAYLYAKAFGTIKLPDGNTITSYNAEQKVITSNLTYVGAGGITIRGNPQNQTVTFDGANLLSSAAGVYSFNQIGVYSNVSTGQTNLSTVPFIYLQANSPSTTLKLVGTDPIILTTDYTNNAIYISVSSINTVIISTILGNQAVILNNKIINADLSTLSTTYGSLVNTYTFQTAISTVSSSSGRALNTYSTSVGSIQTLQTGISTVALVGSQNLLSTAQTLQSNITYVANTFQQGYNKFTTSTINTPFFWTSTLVTLISETTPPIATPTSAISSMGITYFPLFSSFYNPYSDTRVFGEPLQDIPVYTTNIDLTNYNQNTTFTTSGGIIYSTFVAVQGSFTFYPSQNSLTWQVDYSGALYLKVFNTTYSPQLPVYPKSTDFKTGSLTGTVGGFNTYRTDFIYLKRSPTDYLKISNFQDIGTSNFTLSPLYATYGYSPTDTPLYTTTIPFRPPLGFSSLGNLVNSPFLSLSSYVMIASTSYTTGCNTVFPITNSGLASFSFYESTTQITKTAFATDIINYTGITTVSSFSASNTFGYDFRNTNLPSTPYEFQLFFARQQSSETFVISTLYNNIKKYDFAGTVFVSSLLLVSTISSQNAYIQNAQISTINGQAIMVPSLLCTLSTTYGILPNQAQLVSSVLAINIQMSSMSTSYGILPNQAQLNSTYVGSMVQLSTLSTSYGSIFPTNLLTSTTYGILVNFCSFSTSYGKTGNANNVANSSTLSSFITNILGLGSTIKYEISTFSSIWSSIVYDALSSFSTSYGFIASGTLVQQSISSFSTSVGTIPNNSYVQQQLSSFSTSYGPVATTIFVGTTVSTYSTSVGPVGGGGGNIIYNDAWIQQYLINAPSTIYFGTPVSKSSQIFIPWTYPVQINVGFMQNWLQNILAFNTILSTNVSGINYSSILVQQSTNIVNYHNATLPYITGITLVKTAGTSGVQSLTFPQDSLVRSTYVYYNTALAGLTGNNQLLAWYTNYNFGSNVASTIFAAFLTAGQPSLPQRLYSTTTTSNSIVFYFSTPQFVDINDPTSVATISSYTMNLTAIPFSTFRYTGIAPVYQSTTVVVGSPFNFQTAQDGLGGQAVQYSATGLYPDSVYTFKVQAANSASQQGGFASTLSTVTSNLTSDATFSGTLTFASRYYASAYRVYDSLNVTTLVNSATSWTTSAFVSPIQTVAIRGTAFTGTLSISTVITSPVITPGAQIFYNGFPATTPSATTLNNVTLTPTTVYDRFTALGCNAAYQGYFLSASNTITLGASIFVANSTIYTLQTTALQSTSAGITTGQGTFSWYYDGSPGSAAITDAAFAYSPTTAPTYTAISGVQSVYGTATFSTIVGASNLGNYFYANPILSYTYTAGSASLTTTETNLTRIVSGSNGGHLAQAARIGFSNGSVTSAALASAWASTVTLAVYSANLSGNSATSNIYLSTIIDGPSYTLINTTLPAALPTATTSGTTVGCRIWSFSSFDGTNIYVVPFVYANAGNNSYTNYLYSHANSLIDNTVAATPAYKELQVANGAHRTVGTSGYAYLNYVGTYYGNTLSNSITYTSIAKNTTLRFATFGWKTTSSATNYTKITFIVNYLTSGTDTIAISNNLAVFSAGNYPTVPTDKVFLFYRVEDQASVLPTNAGSATTCWLDANGTTGNAASALNYYNDTTGNQTQIYGGVASGATSGSGTITFPNVFVPAFATSGKDIRIIARFGVPMNWNFAMTTITAQLSL